MHSIFSLNMIRYIVKERTLELLDTPYYPFAWSGILWKRRYWCLRPSIFILFMIMHLVKERTLEFLDTPYYTLVWSGILCRGGYWRAQTLNIYPFQDQAQSQRKDIEAPRNSSFSICVIRYIVTETEFELLDTSYFPLAWSVILWKGGHRSSYTLNILPQNDQVNYERGDIGGFRHSIFTLFVIRYIVKTMTSELLDTPYSPLA